MKDLWTLSSLIFSFIAIISILILSFYLYRKYRFGYLASYFYYFVFIGSLSVYGSLNLDVIRLIFRNQALLQSQSVLMYFLLFLSLPLLILGDFMFIRFFREFMGKRLSRRFTILYFSVQFFIYLTSAVFVYAYSGFDPVRVMQLVPVYEVMYSIIEFIIWIIALSQVIIYRKTLKDREKRKAAETLLIIYAAICVAFYLTLYPIRGEGPLYAVRQVFQCSIELVPLLYLRSFLSRYYHFSVFSADMRPNLMQLLSKYHITKREGEIAELVYEGKSNREIKETFFISLQTVKDHIYRIFQKTGVKSRIQLANLIQETVAAYIETRPK